MARGRILAEMNVQIVAHPLERPFSALNKGTRGGVEAVVQIDVQVGHYLGGGLVSRRGGARQGRAFLRSESTPRRVDPRGVHLSREL